MNKVNLSYLAANALTSRKSMDKLFEYIYPMVYHFYKIRLNNEEDAKDLTQNACIKLVKNLDRYKEEKASFTTWMYSIIKNMLVDFFRKKTIPIEEANLNILEGTDSPVKSLLKKEEEKKLKDILKTLGERQKEILEMRYFFNMKNKEIADLLKIKERTVSSLISRSFEKIKNLLMEYKL